jgi:hypothetical protein
MHVWERCLEENGVSGLYRAEGLEADSYRTVHADAERARAGEYGASIAMRC